MYFCIYVCDVHVTVFHRVSMYVLRGYECDRVCTYTFLNDALDPSRNRRS